MVQPTEPTKRLLYFIVSVLVAHFASVHVRCLSLSLDRPTASTILVDIICDSPCEGNFTWEYKSLRSAPWGKPPRIRKHYLNPLAYYITGLSYDAQHYLRVRLDPGGKYSNELEARTCKEHLPPATGMRVADAGPGWLDIRWTPPKENCLGRYYYRLRYKAGDADYGPQKIYGYFNKDESRYLVNPSHPCDMAAKEFCVLLTDRVQAGANHTVELQVGRIGEGGKVNEIQTVTAFADPANTGPKNVEVCADRKSAPEYYLQEGSAGGNALLDSAPMDGGVALPLWVAAVLGTVFSLIMAILLGLALGYSLQESARAKKQKFEDLALVPRVLPEEERNVRPRDLASSQHNKAFEACNEDVAVYEEINFGDHSPWSPTTAR